MQPAPPRACRYTFVREVGITTERHDRTGTLLRSDSASPHLNISSFGEDQAGELYVCDLNGAVYRITATVKP